jgi:methanogenic corrinoid protein MtbC1
MINACLESEGVDTIYLGGNLPIRSLDQVIKQHKPNYIFISITMQETMNSLVSLLDHIRDKHDSNIVIGVGGQGISDETNLRDTDTLLIKDIDSLIDLLNE